MDGWTAGRVLFRSRGGGMDGRLDGWTAGWLDGWMAGRLDGWTTGRLDGWMDTFIHVYIDALSLVCPTFANPNQT